MTFDVIVIGSGFGGAISACRLAERGYRVLVLERGRRWTRETFPRVPGDPWLWDAARPERRNGWLDLRIFPHMAVAQGAAVGGGSLIYANISCEAPPRVFEKGWPPEITYAELKPHYDAVARFMNVQPLPVAQWTERTRLLKRAADAIGEGARFRALDLAVSFDPQWSYDLPDATSAARSSKFTNAQGVEQGTCVHAGLCDIGCPVLAKNTLDLNYLAWAERHHAEIRPLHLATAIEPAGEGYRVRFDRLEGGARRPGDETARVVIVAAGSLGSTELLLRCRDEHRTLPRLSRFLGQHWSSNGDFLTPAIHEQPVRPTVGPTISGAIDFLDGSRGGEAFWIQDGGFPDIVEECLRGSIAPRSAIHRIQQLLGRAQATKHLMPWFAQGVDAGNGTLALRRPWWWLGRRRLHLDWDVTRSVSVIRAIVEAHEQLARATGGTPHVPPTWSLLKNLITPHPLGGCNMGVDPSIGVVDHQGEVFGYRNLYVADGAIVPEAIGVNPSRTIGALAEHIAARIAAAGR